MGRTLHGRWLGRRRYGEVHEEQKRLVALRQAGHVEDTVLFLEHEPVVTLGRGSERTRNQHILVSKEALAQRGVDWVETARGGDVTVHAPGQLVCYPIIDLAPDRCDVRRYVADLVETMRRLSSECGVEAGEVPELIGLWTDRDAHDRWTGGAGARIAKVGAIGVKISRWVTMHGFALNLSTDLALFDLIVPCGISAHGVTSIAELTGHAPDVKDAASRAFALLADVLGGKAGRYDDDSSVALAPTQSTFA